MSTSMGRGRGAFVAALVLAMVWLVTLGAGPVSAAACTNLCYVNGATGNDANGGDTPAAAKKTIQAAITQVTAGGQVVVAAGTYNEDLVIGKGLTLSGAGPALTTIDPVSTYVNILAGNVTVEDLTIANGNPHGVQLSKTDGPTPNVTFDTVHFTTNAMRGIEIHNGVVATNLQVLNCLFDGNETGLRLASDVVVDGLTLNNTIFQNHLHVTRGMGIYQAGGNDGYVKNLHVVNSTFSNNYVSGIHVEEAVDAIIEDSEFSGNGRGFHLVDYDLTAGAASGNILIQNNTFTDQKEPAVQLWSGHENGLGGVVTVDNNTFDQDTGALAGDRGVIDVAQGNGLAHAAVIVSNNVITFSGNPLAAQTNFGILLRGGVDAITVTGNAVDGDAAGANVYTYGLGVFSGDLDFGAIEATAVIDAHHNAFTGLGEGVVVYDDVSDVVGNLPAGASLKVRRNDLSGNAAYGMRSGGPTGSDGECNWWGNANGPSGAGPGSGSAVSAFVDFDPWLASDNLDGSCAVPGSGGTITVKKETSPDGDTTDFLFDPSWSALNFTLKDGESHSSGTLSAGNYAVAELNPPAGWTLSSSGCVNGAATAPVNAIPVADGDAWVCTFNNTKKGTITVVKQTTPDGNPTEFEFDPSWGGPNFTLSDGQSQNSGPLTAGNYAVAEIDLPAYWTQQSAGCVNGAATAPINAIPVANGDAWVCTFNNVLDLPGDGLLYISPNHNNGTVGGVAYNDEDIVVNVLGTNSWAMYFDGTDVGITKNLTDFTFTPDGCMLMTFNGNQNVPGVGKVKPQDLVKFCATQTGADTAGTFTMYFDGSDVGLAAGAEIIDALEVLPNGDLLISTKSSSSMPQNPGPPVTGKKSDLMVFHGTSYGANTAGTWEVYFDSLTVNGLKKENIISLYMDAGLDKYVSFWDKFNVGGVMGDANDIVVIHPDNTVTKFWEGTDWGYSGRVHGLHIVLGP